MGCCVGICDSIKNNRKIYDFRSKSISTDTTPSTKIIMENNVSNIDLCNISVNLHSNANKITIKSVKSFENMIDKDSTLGEYLSSGLRDKDLTSGKSLLDELGESNKDLLFNNNDSAMETSFDDKCQERIPKMFNPLYTNDSSIIPLQNKHLHNFSVDQQQSHTQKIHIIPKSLNHCAKLSVIPHHVSNATPSEINAPNNIPLRALDSTDIGTKSIKPRQNISKSTVPFHINTLPRQIIVHKNKQYTQSVIPIKNYVENYDDLLETFKFYTYKNIIPPHVKNVSADVAVVDLFDNEKLKLCLEREASKYNININFIQQEDVNILSIINSGSIGDVYNGKLKLDNKLQIDVAIKIMNKKFMLKKHCVKNVVNEILVLSKLTHKYIVKCYGIVLTYRDIFIVMEKCKISIDTLFNYKYYFSEELLHAIIFELIEGLKYVHNNKIIHRDIKEHNILIGNDNHVRLIDFNSAKIFSSTCTINDCTTTEYIGSPLYMAPEITNNSKYSFGVDFYCVGILIIKLLACGKVKNIKKNDIASRESIAMFLNTNHIKISDDLKDFILTLTHGDPILRLHNDIANHSWLTCNLKANITDNYIGLKKTNKTNIFTFPVSLFNNKYFESNKKSVTI